MNREGAISVFYKEPESTKILFFIIIKLTRFQTRFFLVPLSLGLRMVPAQNMSVWIEVDCLLSNIFHSH